MKHELHSHYLAESHFVHKWTRQEGFTPELILTLGKDAPSRETSVGWKGRLEGGRQADN